MTTLLHILLIAFLWVFVIDIVKGWDTISSWLAAWLTKGKMHNPFPLRPFSCSLCMTWWSGLLYLAIVGHFTLPWVAVVAFVAYMTPRIKDGLLLLDAALAWLINKLNNIIS